MKAFSPSSSKLTLMAPDEPDLLDYLLEAEQSTADPPTSEAPGWGTAEAYLEQLGAPPASDDVPVGTAHYSVMQEFCEQMHFGASEAVIPQAPPPAGYTNTDEMLERLAAAPSERRSEQRVERLMPADLVEPERTRVVIIDMSPGGIRLGCVEPLAPATRVAIFVGGMRLEGQVRRCARHLSGNYEVGIQLEALAGDEAERYRRLRGAS
ncbi:PilZ domain-containing protein [bacterium CPR1]|nr:PilZ domain-containing protein [bacterium CPR1]